MCQIIAIDTTVKKIKSISNDKNIMDNLSNDLNNKGGEYIRAVIAIKDNNHYKMIDDIDINEVFGKIRSYLKFHEKDRGVYILLFSRQQPEMELIDVENQPYSESVHDFSFAVHGTIFNDNEIASELGVEIQADTEILKFMPVSEFHHLEGTFALIGVSNTDGIILFKHGLNIWQNSLISNNKFFGNIFSTSSLDWCLQPVITLNIEKEIKKYDRLVNNDKKLHVAFSSGMDIALSVVKELSLNNYTSCELIYFAWGSRAENAELSAIDKFIVLFKKLYPNCNFSYKIIPCVDYFSEFFKITSNTPPKIFNGPQFEVGVSAETENPITYVPYRNTQFALIMASMAEANHLKRINFLFGLNLSEGMVFMDNSESWLTTINDTIKYGGKNFNETGTYNVLAPYHTKTKSNMIKEFKKEFGQEILDEILEISFSCYYPQDDGSSCGKCGSCLLREKAILNTNPTEGFLC